MNRITIAITVTALLVTSAVQAQTRKPPPLPSETLQQLDRQAIGQFPRPEGRPKTRGKAGQIQGTWNYALKKNKNAGTKEFIKCGACVYPFVTREFMVSTVTLPEGVEIEDTIDVGDSTSFEVKPRGRNRFAVRPTRVGVDSNIVVYGNDGDVYTFYVTAEDFSSKRVPHVKVRIKHDPNTLATMTVEPAPARGRESSEGLAGQLSETIDAALASETEPGPIPAVPKGTTIDEPPAEKEPEKRDYIEHRGFDPGKVHGFDKYHVYGSKALEPLAVFRDEAFTFIHFGERWGALELPTAYVVDDGVDEVVNSRVSGTTFIVESIAKTITLKAGQKHLCLVYEG